MSESPESPLKAWIALYKKWWWLQGVVIVVLLGLLYALAKGPMAPFIYTNF